MKENNEDKLNNSAENEENLEQIGKETQEHAKNFLERAKQFMIELLDIRHDTNEEGTIQNIRDGISMQGHTAWILIFSILIASIGLNANSAAVVIGAMLISPLMGPILGVGAAIGINDIVMLRRSVTNLGVMVGLSVLTSFIFFSIPLFQDSTSEILARTRPDIRDVLIALSGGLALIIAITRPSAQTNTVAGVAIATALMPPLCTAGYGLASGQIKYFFGAIFLFTINGVFIALATFMIVKYLRFRMVKYVNSKRRKRTMRIASAIAFVIIAGSIFSFYNLVLENNFKRKAHNFIVQLKDEGVVILGDDAKNISYENRRITLPILGKVSDERRAEWEQAIADWGLKDVALVVQQEDNSELEKQVSSLQELYSNNNKLLNLKEETIREKEDKIRLLETELEAFYKNRIAFKDISEEAAINYENLQSIGFYEKINTNFESMDTTTVFEVQWKDSISSDQIDKDAARLNQWLKKRLELDKLSVVTVSN